MGAGSLKTARLEELNGEDGLALVPVAGAKFVSLQSIEHSQDFFGIAADREIVDRDEANDAFGIDEEGGPLATRGERNVSRSSRPRFVYRGPRTPRSTCRKRQFRWDRRR